MMRVETIANRRGNLELAAPRVELDQAQEARGVANVTLYSHLAVVTVNSIPIAMSPKEFALARTLFEQPGELVTHERCFAALGGAVGLKSARLLRVYVFALRQKLRAAGAMTVIVTARGRGYVVRELRTRG
jgi:DNA-binding response OmpR family regulator